MKDKITRDRLYLLHPLLRDEAISIWDEIDATLTGRAICRCAYSLRTFSEQDGLFAQGRTKPGKIVTNAKGGQSYHNYGLAVDIVLLKDTNGDGTFDTASWETNVDFDGDGKADWIEVVNIFKRHGWEAGIDWHFKDSPHFQKTFGFSVVDLQKKYNNKEFLQIPSGLLVNKNEYLRIQKIVYA
jgi:peptidoglycan L-alanyl-D-glutamate endopeptidase CwlK